MRSYKHLGIDCDVVKLSAGMYELMKDRPRLRYGMLPAEMMESFEQGLKVKIPDRFYSRTAGELVEYGKKIREEIEHEVCCEILRLATEEGICIV